MPEYLRRRTFGFVPPYGMAAIYPLERSVAGLAKTLPGTLPPPQPTKVHAASAQTPANA